MLQSNNNQVIITIQDTFIQYKEEEKKEGLTQKQWAG